jgi:hypothetical protein
MQLPTLIDLLPKFKSFGCPIFKRPRLFRGKPGHRADVCYSAGSTSANEG